MWDGFTIAGNLLSTVPLFREPMNDSLLMPKDGFCSIFMEKLRHSEFSSCSMDEVEMNIFRSKTIGIRAEMDGILSQMMASLHECDKIKFYLRLLPKSSFEIPGVEATTVVG